MVKAVYKISLSDWFLHKPNFSKFKYYHIGFVTFWSTMYTSKHIHRLRASFAFHLSSHKRASASAGAFGNFSVTCKFVVNTLTIQNSYEKPCRTPRLMCSYTLLHILLNIVYAKRIIIICSCPTLFRAYIYKYVNIAGLFSATLYCANNPTI